MAGLVEVGGAVVFFFPGRGSGASRETTKSEDLECEYSVNIIAQKKRYRYSFSRTTASQIKAFLLER